MNYSIGPNSSSNLASNSFCISSETNSSSIDSCSVSGESKSEKSNNSSSIILLCISDSSWIISSNDSILTLSFLSFVSTIFSFSSIISSSNKSSNDSTFRFSCLVFGLSDT